MKDVRLPSMRWNVREIFVTSQWAFIRKSIGLFLDRKLTSIEFAYEVLTHFLITQLLDAFKLLQIWILPYHKMWVTNERRSNIMQLDVLIVDCAGRCSSTSLDFNHKLLVLICYLFKDKLLLCIQDIVI